MHKVTEQAQAWQNNGRDDKSRNQFSFLACLISGVKDWNACSKHKRGRTKAAMNNPETNCACLFAFFIRGVEDWNMCMQTCKQASKQRGGCKRAMPGGEKGVSWGKISDWDWNPSEDWK
jgi:hypothetical protein